MTTETFADRIARLTAENADAFEGVGEARLATIAAAADLGASDAALVALADASYVGRGETVVLPPHRFENLSRGRGWARQGQGDTATWGERTSHGYRVGAGKWTIGATDGFSRKASDAYTVKHLEVAPGVIWTVAS